MSSERVQKAIENHHKGYNCAQSLVCAYCDLYGLDEKMAYRMAECFGSGMGNTQGVCGAVSGMLMLAGMANSDGTPGSKASRAGSYKTAGAMTTAFKDMNTSFICRELYGLDGAPKLRSCDGCIEDAANLFEQFILNKKEEQKG